MVGLGIQPFRTLRNQPNMSTVPFNRPRPLDPVLTKRLPCSLDAERSVLGAILLDNQGISTIADHLHIDDFFLDQHKRIFEAMLEFAKLELAAGRSLGHSIDLVTLTEFLHSRGQLEASGGAPYIASLADGMPRCTNIMHYAQIVIDTATRRKIIHLTHNIQQRAFEEGGNIEGIITGAEASIKSLVHLPDINPAVVVGFRSLLTLKMPPVEFVIEPLLTVGGTGMLFAWRGVGKSFVMTEMATQIALGMPNVWMWPISRAYRVLYIYGEMHGATIKERAIQIARGHALTKHDVILDQLETNFGLMSKDFQMLEGTPRNAKTWRPKISSARDRNIIEERIFGGGYEVLILDNISTLWPASQEGESDMVSELQEWFVDLNQKRITIIFLHHAGKGGEQRGWSGKEDILDFTLKLKTPGDYKQEEQLRAAVTIEKKRHEAKDPAFLQPFEISLRTDVDGAQWLMRPMRDAQIKTAFEDFNNGMKAGEVAQDIGVPRRTVYNWYAKWKKDNDPKHWTDLQ
jgi:hypothetical protein